MNKEVYWSRFADNFEEKNNYVAGKKNIAAIQAALIEKPISGTVIELGCGNGTYSKTLAEKASHVIATDFSDEMVMESKKRLEHYSNILVEKQDCFHLSYDNASFDCVAMINLLHIIPTPEKALRESKRVLKERGEIVIVSFTMEGVSFLNRIRLIARYLKTYGKPPTTAQTLTIESTKRLLAQEGFDIVEARLIGTTAKAVFVRASLA